MAMDDGGCVTAAIAAGAVPAAALFRSLGDETRLRAEGRQSFYALTRPGLMDLLAAAEGVLGATAHA